jgi:hypothetical protein
MMMTKVRLNCLFYVKLLYVTNLLVSVVDEDYESREEYLADKRAFEAIHKANK